MTRKLTVTVPAADLHLLSIAEMRAAAGIADNSQDAELNAQGLKICAAITSECKVVAGDGAEPTLKQETLAETLRLVDVQYLFLARRHNVSVSSIVENGIALTTDEFEVATESGKLTRLVDDVPAKWCANKVVVTYQAGFTTIPADLKMAATDFFRLVWLEQNRDPSLKSEEVDIPGVERVKTDYWVGSVPGQSSEGAVPDVVSGQLQRFRVYG